MNAYQHLARARKNLAIAKGRAADDGMFPTRETAWRMAQSQLRRA